MNLTLERLQLDPDVTIGALYVDGQWRAWTCEDCVRDGPKIPGQTAIPYGSYNVIITLSQRFGRKLPLLENVPEFTGIRIHPGNTAADSSGCIIVGLDRMAKSVGRSRAAFNPLFADMQAAINFGKITIDIVKP